MKKIRQLLLLFVSMISTTLVQAQGNDFEKFMRSEGRSYVVVAVMLTILFGLILYLIRLDRKITKLERDK